MIAWDLLHHQRARRILLRSPFGGWGDRLRSGVPHAPLRRVSKPVEEGMGSPRRLFHTCPAARLRCVASLPKASQRRADEQESSAHYQTTPPFPRLRTSLSASREFVDDEAP